MIAVHSFLPFLLLYINECHCLRANFNWRPTEFELIAHIFEYESFWFSYIVPLFFKALILFS
jgi:hypothetical protein